MRRSAQRLSDGSTLIADGGNGRVLRVSSAGEVVDVYGAGGGAGSNEPIGPLDVSATSSGLLVADAAGHRLIETGYAVSGQYVTGDLDLGVPGANKWITKISPSAALPKGTSIKVEYKLAGGSWKPAGGGSTFTIASPYPASYARFRFTLKTSDPGVSPTLKSWAATYYLAKPPVYKPPKKKGDGSSSGATETAGNGGSSGGTTGGTSSGTGTGTGFGTGSGTGTGTGAIARGSGNPAFRAVATGVPVDAARAMLSGWVMDEKLGGQVGEGGGGAPVADPAGLVAAALVVSFGYSMGLWFPAIASGLRGTFRLTRTFVLRSLHG